MSAGFFLAAHGVEHFSASEVCPVGRTWGGATAHAPPPDFMLTVLKLIEGPLAWIRWFQGAAPIGVNSWYRDTEYNEAVGGGVNSMHLTGAAVDITKRGWAPERVALALHYAYPMADELGVGLYKTFIHIDIRGMLGRSSPARWSGDDVGEWWKERAA